MVDRILPHTTRALIKSAFGSKLGKVNSCVGALWRRRDTGTAPMNSVASRF